MITGDGKKLKPVYELPMMENPKMLECAELISLNDETLCRIVKPEEVKDFDAIKKIASDFFKPDSEMWKRIYMANAEEKNIQSFIDKLIEIFSFAEVAKESKIQEAADNKTAAEYYQRAYKKSEEIIISLTAERHELQKEKNQLIVRNQQLQKRLEKYEPKKDDK